MFRTKSRRNIRSKRNLSRKNRSRKNRNSRRVKGGVFGISVKDIKRALGLKSRLKSQESEVPKDRVLDVVTAWNKNQITLCEYADLLKRYKDKDIKLTKKKFEKEEAKLMLHRIRFLDDYKFSEYPSPMSIKAILDKHDKKLELLYVHEKMDCTAPFKKFEQFEQENL